MFERFQFLTSPKFRLSKPDTPRDLAEIVSPETTLEGASDEPKQSTTANRSDDAEQGSNPADAHIAELFEALEEGNFKARLGNDAHAYAQIANPALDAVDNAVSEVLALADLIANGDLTTDASGQYKGDLALMRDALNTIRSGLTQLIGNADQTNANVLRKSQELSELTRTLAAQSAQQTEISDIVAEQIGALRNVGDTLIDAVGESVKTTAEAAATSQKGHARSAEAVNAIEKMRKGSEEISVMLALIEDIAQQTNLLAINASIEAARAGDAGAGFLVVSAEVKALADRSSEATEKIRKTTKTIEAAVADCANAIDACGTHLGDVASGLKKLDAIAETVNEATGAQAEAVAQAEAESSRLNESVEASLSATSKAEEMAHELTGIVDTLGHALARFQLSDTDMENHVKSRAAAVAQALEAALSAGEISEADLFSCDYSPVEGSNPPQFTTPYTELIERVGQDIVETAFDIGPGVIFSAVMNNDGYLALNSRKFSKPQRPNDPVWNAANCRNRRYFRDRVGMGVSTSKAEVLLQAYRREMGGGTYVTMKDISAPIFVRGRHWGGLRIGYKSEEADAKAAPLEEAQQRLSA